MDSGQINVYYHCEFFHVSFFFFFDFMDRLSLNKFTKLGSSTNNEKTLNT